MSVVGSGGQQQQRQFNLALLALVVSHFFSFNRCCLVLFDAGWCCLALLNARRALWRAYTTLWRTLLAGLHAL